MVKTFTGTRGRRKKIPMRRQPLSELQHDSTTATEIERATDVESNMGEEIRIGEEARESMTNVAEGCEVQRPCEEEAAAEGEKSGNKEENMDSSDNTSVDGDDCGVINEDGAGYQETEPSLKENDDGGFFEEQLSEDAHFVEAGCEDVNADYNSNDVGHDMWDDEHILDPLSDDDREEEESGRHINCGPDELLALGQTFNNAAEFRYAVLKYSLKTQYDIMFYKSSVGRKGDIYNNKKMSLKQIETNCEGFGV